MTRYAVALLAVLAVLAARRSRSLAPVRNALLALAALDWLRLLTRSHHRLDVVPYVAWFGVAPALCVATVARRRWWSVAVGYGVATVALCVAYPWLDGLYVYLLRCVILSGTGIAAWALSSRSSGPLRAPAACALLLASGEACDLLGAWLFADPWRDHYVTGYVTMATYACVAVALVLGARARGVTAQ